MGKDESKTLEIGTEVKGKSGSKYARFKGEPAVFNLPAATIAILERTYLAYVPREILKLKSDDVESFTRSGIPGELEINRKMKFGHSVSQKLKSQMTAPLMILLQLFLILKPIPSLRFLPQISNYLGLILPLLLLVSNLRIKLKKFFLVKRLKERKAPVMPNLKMVNQWAYFLK